jgi:predicted cupin superfamily sugar epimerase
VFTEIGEERSASSTIFSLLTKGNIVRLHRLKSDEVFSFYDGNSLTIIELTDDAEGYKETLLGKVFLKGEVLQHVVKANTWFGSYYPHDDDSYSLFGCTVSPGFEFSDSEFGSSKKLKEQFPLATQIIEKLTVGL